MASYNPLNPSRRRDIALVCILGAGLGLCLIWILDYYPLETPLRFALKSGQRSSLTDLALQKVLNDASPIFGAFSPDTTSLSTSTWMKAYPDSTLLVHMNLPGTHDSATWNYTETTQQALKHASKLGNFSPSSSANYRCQTHSIASMLEAGMRVFDLRYAYDVTRTQLVFWHGNALQSETATVDDVLFGFYHWLDLHPSEAVILSFQHEAKTDDVGTQMALYQTLTSPAAKEYFVQSRGVLGTLGEARGKITLFQRFDLDLIPSSYEESLPGLHFSPKKWTVNGASINLIYNTTTSATAYIQDYYHPTTPKDGPLSVTVDDKFQALTAHLEQATTTYPDSLFWSFASSTKTDDDPPITPRMMALGDGQTQGVNQRLMEWLERAKGKRLGIVLFDFFEEPEGLVGAFLRLRKPGG